MKKEGKIYIISKKKGGMKAEWSKRWEAYSVGFKQKCKKKQSVKEKKSVEKEKLGTKFEEKIHQNTANNI